MYACFIYIITFFMGFFVLTGQDSINRNSLGSLERGPVSVSQKGLLQFEQEFNFLKGNGVTELLSRLQITYGITEQIALRSIIPSVLKLKDEGVNAQSFGDIFIMFDWYFFRTANALATITTGVKLPTASKPLTAVYSAQSFDIPIEFQPIFDFDDWYAKANFFALIKVKSRTKVKFGDVYSFDLVLGPKYSFKHHHGYFKTLFLLGRMSGAHARFNFIEGVPDDNSGGTFILLGPEVALANKNVILNSIFQLPILNRPFGIQNVIDFRFYFSVRVLV